MCWTRPASPAEVIVYLFPRSHYDRLQPYASPEVPAASAQASMPKTDRSVCQVLGVPLESIYLKSFSPRPQQTPRCATSNKLKQGRVLLHHLGPPEECGPGFALCLPSFGPDLPLHSKDLLQQLIDSPPRAQRVKRQSRQAFETAPGFVNPKFFCTGAMSGHSSGLLQPRRTCRSQVQVLHSRISFEQEMARAHVRDDCVSKNVRWCRT